MSDTLSKIKERNGIFLKTPDVKSIKIQQEIRAVKLRKEKRMEGIKKRRISGFIANAEFSVPKEAISRFLIGKYPQLADERFPSIKKIDILIEEVKNARSYEELSYALESLKVVYGKNLDMPNDYIFTDEFVDIFMALLNSDFVRGKILILAILANAFASKSKIIDKFICKDIIIITKEIVRLHVDVGLADNGLYVLGNIIGEGLAYHNKAVGEGVHKLILNLLTSEAFQPSQTAWKLCIWILNNLCKRLIDNNFTSDIINAMPLLLRIRPDDYETTSNLLHIGNNLSFNSLENCILISKKNLFPVYLKYCIDPKQEFSSPSLRFIGNIVYYSNDLAKVLLDMGLLPKLTSNLTNRSPKIQKEVLSIFNNIFLTTKSIALSVINDSYFNTYLKILNMGSETIKNSAFLGLCNAISLKDMNIINSLLNFGFLEKLLEFSTSSNIEILKKLLSSLRIIFSKASDIMNNDQYQDFLKKFTSIGGCDVLESIQFNKNDEIHLEAKTIIDEFIGTETEEIPLNIVGTFNFS